MKYPATFVLLAILASACKPAQNVRPFYDESSLKHLKTLEESRVHQLADEFEGDLYKAGAVHQDRKLRRYVQGVMQRLFPEMGNAIQVKLLKQPGLNAYALPNGSVYLYSGLIARLENEAQLAFILAHEGAHFVDRHYLRTKEYRKVSDWVYATPLLVSQAAVFHALAGYSRDLESKADQLGIERLKAAGYDPREGVAAMRILRQEALAVGEGDDASAYASHPTLKQRIELLEGIVQNWPAHGDVNASAFGQAAGYLRDQTLQQYLASDQYQVVINLMWNSRIRKQYPAHSDFYLGEAYRRRGQKYDLDLAIDAYQKCLEAVPDYAPAYKALGFVYMKKQQWEMAEQVFSKYLSYKPTADEAAYVYSYLKKIAQRKGE